MSDDENAGDAYGRLINDQLSQERQRKTSLESRGITVITTSSALATLLFALTAGLTSAKTFKLPEAAKLPLILALAAFVFSASFGLIVNIPLKYREVAARALERVRKPNYWSARAQIGQLRVAEAQITILAAARAANRIKVALLLSAISFELAAVIFLAWAIGIIIYY